MTTNNPMLDKLQAILPAIRANAAKAEAMRMIPQENIDMLHGIGLNRAFLPKAYGGLEMSLPEFTDCIAALAGACCSTAWGYSLLCTHNHQIAMFSKETQNEIWGDNPDVVASSSIAPFGRYEETDGGIIFTGDMKWSSGVDHADWILVGLNRMVNDEKIYSFAIIPRAEFTIIDDWHAAGMCGSGTKTARIEGVFVPERRIQAAKDMMEGRHVGRELYPDSNIYHTPYRPYFACGFAAMSLGVAERMIEVYQDITKNRVRAYTGAKVAGSIAPVLRMAESYQQVCAARAYLEKTWNEHKEYSERHQYPDRYTLAHWRTNQAYAIKMCIEAVNRLWAVMGGSNWYNEREGQRLWRESNMTAAHAYTDYDVCAQIIGRELLGMEPDPALL
ncbi:MULTISPECIES: p-hydroxyphenylacetate 3-hydroxylase oxygenase component [unclassified Oceanobacter]|uniref:p-hydroxyphenylacetate 3-hydroxylase oxygenase component n=2 Tax=Gammaproteobacteria TaxID=1236 RepID=UPI0026E1E98E|nr:MULTISPECIES: flavin-dependent monooxygenase [unclassified Oceanobacter]MDO6681878.1 flavin-dependent monooxygenase [Oceanobacter sp. 5_MG-2023]MDP2609464.1 flavin-dependent monooxygenase [Oceanobacter sp. 1_MG-2023]MDP2612836.1 flavin-dependent monooxygenase [Oceanobacter sp. 2_MG-2023]